MAESLGGRAAHRRPTLPEERERRLMLGLTLGLLLAVVVGAATAILLANGTDRFKIQGGHLYERNRIADCASMYPDDTAKADACIANLP